MQMLALYAVILSAAKDLWDSTAIERQHSPRDASLRSAWHRGLQNNVGLCVIARLETSRGNLLAVLCHHEHNGLTQLHFYNHNSEICGYRSEGTINFIYKKLVYAENYSYICLTMLLNYRQVRWQNYQHTPSHQPPICIGGGILRL